MTLELPRFSQRFVNSVNTDSDEGRFVSSVGEVTYLARANSARISEVDFEIRRPLILDLFDSTVEREMYADAYSDMYEQELAKLGLEELVLALNGLKVAANTLKGRNILWTGSDFRDRSKDSRNDEYILGSRIGFYPNLPDYPATYLELSKNTYDDSGLLTPIAEMWDIEILGK